jgi:hypothetical protein
MRAFVFALLTIICCTAQAADPAPLSVRQRLDDDAIRKAVRDTLAEKPDNPRLHEADTLRANRYDVFARQVEDATVPDCLHPDGLKRQPTFFLGGLLALPFVAVAKVRGKCQ